MRINGAAIDVRGLKLVIRLKAVDGILQRVKSPDSVPDSVSDQGLWVRVQQGADGISGDEHGVDGRMRAMLIKPCHIRPGAPALFGRCRPFGADAHRIKTREITRQHGFEANVTLPMGAVIIDILEALTATETQRVQPDVAGIRTVAAIVLAMHVEGVQVFITPVESDLQHRVEVRKGRVTTHEQPARDQRTDLTQDDTELIDAGRFNGLMHAQSVPRRAPHFKVSPRNLALSIIIVARSHMDGSVPLRHSYRIADQQL